MQFNPTSLIENIPNEILGTIGTHLSFQDLNRLALTGKVGEIWANSAFDMLAKELLCQGKTAEERKFDLAKIYCEVPFFIRSLHDDIDKLKDKVFENGYLTIEYGEDSFTPFFLKNFASKMLTQVLGGCDAIASEYEEIVTTDGGFRRLSMLEYYYPPKNIFSGIIAAGSTGIKIRQTPSNHISNVVSPKLIEALKKASEIFFNKLCIAYKIPDLDKDKIQDKEKLEKYKNKYAFVIYEKDKEKLNLSSCHCALLWILRESKLEERVDFLNYTSTRVYGEKEDIEKFITILHAQQSPNISTTTLKQARGII